MPLVAFGQPWSGQAEDELIMIVGPFQLNYPTLNHVTSVLIFYNLDIHQITAQENC